MMDWSRAHTIMDTKAIKTDVIASEDAYFMATHVPFEHLEIIKGGQQTDAGAFITEEALYKDYVYNPDNLHRLMIVRGSNGTGKSHLIRWLAGRFKNDRERYDENKEKIIFLRRLSNSVRGAISQILEEDIIFEPEMQAKLEKFVSSTQAMDSHSFKMNIYHQYIIAIRSDTNNKPYSKGIRREISALLTDPRVEDYMLREDGPIDRCYRAITAPSDVVLKAEVTFSEEDFKFDSKLRKEIKRGGSSEAKSFLDNLGEDDAAVKLVKYLNSFTPKVIQGCADISSEGTKEIFVQLRRELKKQGKNLTIFIEDITGFTGLDAELITVLASEHEGENSDLCRVTSVVGITDAYYGQFRDNFINRVQYQVKVTEAAYGTEKFLTEMTARYLNAIYCNPEDLESWCSNGGDPLELPIAEFKPNIEWDVVRINNKVITLFPFNRRSVAQLYEALEDSNNMAKSHGKTPRMFLLYVLKEQLTRFFEGHENKVWKFPTDACIASTIALKNLVHDNEIDNLDYISQEDRKRVKILLQFWGDSTANCTEEKVGKIPVEFFKEVGLESFNGIGAKIEDFGLTSGGLTTDFQHDTDQSKHDSNNDKDINVQQKPVKEKELNARVDAINSWYNGEKLQYSADFRRYVKEFVAEAIYWTGEGIPAYIVHEKLRIPDTIYIDGQAEITHQEQACISISRTNENKAFLVALLKHEYYKSWDFEEGIYFQLKTISWLETHKQEILASIRQEQENGEMLPYIKWCVAVEYIRAVLLGTIKDVNVESLNFKKELLKDKAIHGSNVKNVRSDEWNSCITFMQNHVVEYKDSHELLKESLRTFMGTDVLKKQKDVGFFRSAEFIEAIDDLEGHGWDVGYLLNYTVDSKGIAKPLKHLKDLYGKINKLAETENKEAKRLINEIEKHFDGNVTVSSIVSLIVEIQKLFFALEIQNKPVSSSITKLFGRIVDPKEQAERIMKLYNTLKEALSEKISIKQIKLYSDNSIAYLSDFVEGFNAVEKLVKEQLDLSNKKIEELSGGKDSNRIVEKGIASLKCAMIDLEKLEVQDVN